MRKNKVYFRYFGDLERRFDGGELITISKISAIQAEIENVAQIFWRTYCEPLSTYCGGDINNTTEQKGGQ